MGKCVRIRGSGNSKQNPSPGEAAACLTLRSGRRVPVIASCSPPPGSRRHRRGGAAAPCGRCGGANKAAAAKRACGSPSRRKSAEPRPDGSARKRRAQRRSAGGGAAVAHSHVVARGDSFERPNTNLAAGDDVKHEHGSKGGVAAGPPSPLLQAEMKAFFAAAELAERRRFAESYNYDVALDCPLEGRFERAPGEHVRGRRR